MCNDIIFNEKRSIRSQLFISFSATTVLSILVMLGVSIGLMANLGTEVKDTAKDALEAQSQSHALSTAVETAAVIEAQLDILGNSIAMTNNMQASSLLWARTSTNSLTGGLTTTADVPLNNRTTYGDFLFDYANPSSSPATRPADWGPLAGRARLTGVNGSLTHSSMYIYRSDTQCAVRDNASFASVMTDPVLSTLINHQAHMDHFFQSMLNGTNTTLFFYSAITYAEPSPSTRYWSMRRTFPGLYLETTPCGSQTYNPSTRGWYTSAPINDISLQYYRETFTQELVINMGTKLQNGRYTLVATGLMLLRDVNAVVDSVVVGTGGYAVLMDPSTNEVLVHGRPGIGDLWDATQNRFRLLSETDPGLVATVKSGGIAVPYTEQSTGELFFVAQVPLLDNRFICMVFARRSDYFTTYPSLVTSVDDTTLEVSVTVIIILAAVCIFVLLATHVMTKRITEPIRMIAEISNEVVNETSAEERDYKKIIDRMKPVNTGDELEILSENFTALVSKLNDVEQIKKTRPKYPRNPMAGKIVAERLGVDLSDRNTLRRLGLPVHEEESKGDEPELPAYDESHHDLHNASGSADASAYGTSVQMTSVNKSNLVGPPAYGEQVQSRHSNPTKGPPTSSISYVPAPEAHKVDIYDAVRLPLSYVPDEPKAKAAVYKSRSRGSCSLGLRPKIILPFAVPLLLGLILSMAITVVLIDSNGSDWMSDTKRFMLSDEIQNLQRIANLKSQFIGLFFESTTLEVQTAAQWMTKLLDGQLTRADYVQAGQWLRSYSLIPAQTLVAGSSTPGRDDNEAYSGYFQQDSALCSGTACYQWRDLNVTRQTSTLDLMFRSFYHAKTRLDFIQIGMEQDALTRIYPWEEKASYAAPTSCLVDAVVPPSFCKPCSQLPFAYYDPRCRSWYETGRNGSDPTKVFFQDPRTSSGGSTVTTAATPLRSGGTLSGAFLGVLIFNVLSSTLSNSVNSASILQTGYVYLTDATGQRVVLHPRLVQSECTSPTVACVEQLSPAVAAQFQSIVSSGLASGQGGTTEIEKNGVTWQLAFAPVNTPTIQYGLVVQVPKDEVLAGPNKVEDDIRDVVQSQTIIFALLLATVILLVFAATSVLSRVIVEPINDLTATCELILNDDLGQQVEDKGATSLETHSLLEAFSGMIIALRFGSESYTRGDLVTAQQVFADALQLYTNIKSERGIAISKNNLGSIALRTADLRTAEKYLLEAVQAAREELRRVSEQKDARSIRKAQKTLADRLGNAAVLRREQQDYNAALLYIEEALNIDKETRHLTGMAVRLGQKAQTLQAMGQHNEAAQLYRSAVSILGEEAQAADAHKDRAGSVIDAPEEFQGIRISHAEARRAVAQQFAVMHMGEHAQAAGSNTAVFLLTYALCTPVVCDMGAVARILKRLHKAFTDAGDGERAKLIQGTIDFLGLTVNVQPASKDVVFCLDYSGSMAGGRIKRAVDNMLEVYDTHVRDNDRVGFIRFESNSTTVFSLAPKNAAVQRGYLASSIRPGGGTAFRDAVRDAIGLLSRAVPLQKDKAKQPRQWIVALTDGEDNMSSTSLDNLHQLLKTSSTSLIIVGVRIVPQYAPVMADLCASTADGVYIEVNNDSTEQMKDAFAKVAQMIGGQEMAMEDY